MSDYIERNKLLDSMANAMRGLDCEALTDPEDWVDAAEMAMRECVYNAPATNVGPVVHGRWIRCDRYESWADRYICSNCRHHALTDGDYGYEWSDYCPNCGAKMDEEGLE